MKTTDIVLNAITDAVASQVKLACLPVINASRASWNDTLEVITDISRCNDINIRVDGVQLLNNFLKGRK